MAIQLPTMQLQLSNCFIADQNKGPRKFPSGTQCAQTGLSVGQHGLAVAPPVVTCEDGEEGEQQRADGAGGRGRRVSAAGGVDTDDAAEDGEYGERGVHGAPRSRLMVEMLTP